MGLFERLFADTTADITALSFSERLALSDPFKLPTVVAARQLIADTVSGFPMVTKTGDDRDLLPVPSICARPDPSEPSSDTWEKLVNSLTRYGRAWVRVTALGSNNYPLAAEIVSDRRVTYMLNDAGSKLVAVEIDGRPQDMRMIRCVPFILEAESPVGKSPLVEIRDSLDQLAAAYQFSATYYNTTAATPPYAIMSPTRLQADKAEELLKAWTDARDKSRPAVISGALELKTFQSQSAADALVLDAINQLDATISRVLLLPPSLLNTLSQSSLTYSTTVEAVRQWLALGLDSAYLKRIEAVWTGFLPRGQRAVFDTGSITRMNPREQLDYDIAGVNAGIFTVDEVRAKRGLAPNDALTLQQ